MLRMCSWQTVVPTSGPCARPSTTQPQDPQIPSRQSLSMAIGSVPSRISRLFRASNISRNDWSGETSFTS